MVLLSAECPAACDLCTNAGLVATPAPFELDYVCRGKLQPVPAQLEEAAHAPDGCGFKCRDNMTSVCAQEAGRDACKARPPEPHSLGLTACRLGLTDRHACLMRAA